MMLLGLAGCQNKVDESEQAVSSPVVASVGATQLHEIDIDYEILSMPESMQHLMKDEAARAQVLSVMIQREVVAQKAKEMGLDRDPLVQHRVHQVENSVLIQSVREWHEQEQKEFDDTQVQQFYNKHKDKFVIPEQIHVRHILLSDKQKALEVLKMLKRKPDDFPLLAAQYSIDDSNKGIGGDLNWFAKGTMVKPFEKVAFKLSEKKPLSEPVKTKFGWHIIQLLGKKEGSTPTLEEVRDEIISILRKDALDKWIKNLLEDADVDIKKTEYKLAH